MNFTNKYPKAQTFDELEGGDIMVAEESQPCWNCDMMTRFFEMNYQAYICSEECLKEKDNGFADALSEI